jgi:IMP dehydrogenase
MKPVTVNKYVTSVFDRLRSEFKSISYDDVTLQDLPSEIHPNEVNIESYITKNIKVKSCGILSAAMDTVTSKDLALELCKMGGIPIIHRNMTPKEQTEMVKWVRNKINHGSMIENPVTYRPNDRLAKVQHDIKTKQYGFTSFPITTKDNKLVGLLSKDDMVFSNDSNPELKDLMKSLNDIVLGKKGTTSEEAFELMKKHKKVKLPIVSDDGTLIGMYTWNDVRKDERKKNLYSLDNEGHFLLGASIGVGKLETIRADMLIKDAGCKLLVIDSSHGACEAVKEMNFII